MKRDTTTTKAMRIAASALALCVLLPAADGGADDTALFSNAVAPNVMFLFDTSGSMNNIVWHPSYRLDFVYDTVNCPYIADEADPNYDPKCLQYPLCNITPGDSNLDGTASSWNQEDTELNTKENLTKTRCDNEREIFYDPEVLADSNNTIWPLHYLNWYFSDNVEVDDDGDGYTIEQEITATANGTRSQCMIDAGYATTYAKYRRARVTAAKEIVRDVLCDTNQVAAFRYGLARFDDAQDPDGAYVVVPPADYSTAHANALEAAISAVEGETYTPLAESLYYVYRFFQSRDSSQTAFGKNGITRFPVYDLNTSGGSSGTIPGHPVTSDCQQHFVVIITDGIPTRDDFDSMDLATFQTLIGDYNLPGDETELPANIAMAPDLVAASCNGDCEVSLYLDDIAKFMSEKDFMLESGFSGTQTIDVYTVGFTTTSNANALLKKTAEAGNGKAFFSNNAEELSEDIAEALGDIQAKVQAFASATVPASRTSTEDNFYYSYFIPRGVDRLWEGHLKDFEFTTGGDILTATGKCAVGTDPTAVAPCPTSGTLRETADAHWDAASAMPDPAARTLYYGQGDVTPFTRPPVWSTSNIGPTDLDLVAGDLSDPPYDSAADLDDLADKIVTAFSGCVFGTNCTTRTNELGAKAILGDIFHSNPIVVGNPNSAINENTYRDFAVANRGRDRMIYTGANDGFVHGFLAGIWKTLANDNITPLVPPRYTRGNGVEQFAYMPSETRQTIKRVLATSDASGMDHFSVDGSPTAADAWMYRDFSSGATLVPFAKKEDKVANQWKTVLMGGLRQGGNSYYALDVTDPSSSSYPGYLWDFPCDPDHCASAVNPNSASWAYLMGETWSEPVITRVRVRMDGGTDPRGYERWVAVFGAGYVKDGDPNDPAYDWDPATASPRGRAIFMVDVTTGEVLAVKHFSATAVDVNGTRRGYPEMRYAFASAPAVFDLDFDGFADVIAIGDLGGNMWKWVVSDVGDDPINNSGTYDNIAQPNWPFRILFRGSASTEPPANHASTPGDPTGTHFQSFFNAPTGILRKGTLVLAWGAGERANVTKYENDGSVANNNHFYVVRDTDPYEQSLPAPNPVTGYITESDLATNTEINTQSCASLTASTKGYMIDGRDAEKFTTRGVIFLGELVTGSFIPPDPNGPSSCGAAGQGFVYRFDIDCGTGSYTSNPGTANDKRRRALGSGLPTRPRVSVGAINAGGAGGGGGCENRVVVVTSDGSVDDDCAGSLPSLGTQLRSWRQN